MLLITGTQRCGTSLMAEFVSKCGYKMYGPEDDVGKYEDPTICWSFRKDLKNNYFPWSTYPFHKWEDRLIPLEDLSVDVAKFSFLMMHPSFIQLWWSHRGTQDKLLILVREAESVVKSKSSTEARKKQFALDSSYLQHSPESLKRDWYDSFMQILCYRMDYRILKFPEFLNDWNTVYETLFEWGGLNPPSGAFRRWSETVDMKKVTVP